MLKSTLGAEEEGRIYRAWHTSIYEERSARLLVVCTLLTRDLWEERPSVSSSRRNLSLFGVARGRGCAHVQGQGRSSTLAVGKAEFSIVTNDT